MSEIFTPHNGDESSDERPRLVLDTNTVLALWMFRDPKLDKLRVWIEAGKCRLYSREDALTELNHVLNDGRFSLLPTLRHELENKYRSRLEPPSSASRAVPRGSTLPGCRDPDDQKFLEIAHTLGATHLLTRDKALLRLNGHRLVREHFRILTPEQFQKELPSHSRR